MVKTLTIDFETIDPYISRKMGGGWVFPDGFKILGAAYKSDDGPAEFTEDMDRVKYLVSSHGRLICHNAQYDVGILHRIGADYRSKELVDTMVLAKLYNNSMSSYSLEDLGPSFTGIKKDVSSIIQLGEKLGLKKPMAHMDKMWEADKEVVISYAKKDVEVTQALYSKLMELLYSGALELIPFYSDLIKALVISRARGVRINEEQLEKSRTALGAMYQKSFEAFEAYCPNVNINSTKQLAEAFTSLGLTVGVSEKGGPSVNSEWQKTQTHPAVVALREAKKFEKLSRDFVEGVEERMVGGRIHPEINILGASETGRFSASNPNIQQIPARDEIAAALIRSLFLPNEGERWASLDFSSQEPRLQVHYAFLTDCAGGKELRAAFQNDPNLDLHGRVAKLADIERKQAKTINLGISYGMGRAKLARSLGLDEEEASALLRKYNKLSPFLKQLSKAIQASGEAKGFIRTILGRRLVMDMDKPYKAINKLIQGSAADQTSMAIVQCYKEGIDILFSVHDEINLSIKDPATALRVKEIMETCTPLSVPSVAELKIGTHWGECK